MPAIARKKKTRPSQDPRIEPEGATPYIPREKLETRIAKAKRLPFKHGMDAMVLFAYSRKPSHGG